MLLWRIAATTTTNGRRPTFLGRELRVDEIEAEQWMLRIVDAPVHVHTTALARVTLDGRARVDHG